VAPVVYRIVPSRTPAELLGQQFSVKNWAHQTLARCRNAAWGVAPPPEARIVALAPSPAGARRRAFRVDPSSHRGETRQSRLLTALPGRPTSCWPTPLVRSGSRIDSAPSGRNSFPTSAFHKGLATPPVSPRIAAVGQQFLVSGRAHQTLSRCGMPCGAALHLRRLESLPSTPEFAPVGQGSWRRRPRVKRRLRSSLKLPSAMWMIRWGRGSWRPLKKRSASQRARCAGSPSFGITNCKRRMPN
jgi:hypothetical protein